MLSQEVLPFPPTPSASTAGRTMQESTYERRVEPRRLPDDAPNILIVLIDDVGPGLPTTFGGEVRTDTLTRIHDEGIGYNRFTAHMKTDKDNFDGRLRVGYSGFQAFLTGAF